MNNTSEDLSNSFLSFVSEYKVLIVIALLAGIGGILGYNFYLDSKANQNSEAADVFAQLSSNYAMEEKDEALIDALHSKLETDYRNTGFATLGLILKAKHFGEHQESEEALNTYYAIIDKTDGIFGDNIFNSIARINAAQLENNLGNFNAAMEALQGLANPNDPLVLEIMGDSHAGLGNSDAAIASYSKAIEKEQSEEVKIMLRSKISMINLSE